MKLSTVGAGELVVEGEYEGDVDVEVLVARVLLVVGLRSKCVVDVLVLEVLRVLVGVVWVVVEV